MDAPLPDKEAEQMETWHSFYSQPGSEFEFRLARTPDAAKRDGTGVTFSEEAMDTLMQHLMIYIGTRLTRWHDKAGEMPQSMTVRIKVSLDKAILDWGDDETDIVINAKER